MYIVTYVYSYITYMYVEGFKSDWNQPEFVPFVYTADEKCLCVLTYITV